MPETNARIKVCHDTAANFKTNNPTLLVGEWALETDTKKMKIGDGVTAYNALPYSTAEDSDEWRRPDDWVDIRSGALPESIYLLVGHSADYATYPDFGVYATISDSGTYDVYVDGIKQATTASGTATTLNWQTLALTSGWDVTYPASLRTHIVRITPTSSANAITQLSFTNTISFTQGILWMHSTLSTAIRADYLTYGSSSSTQQCPVLKAVTSSQEKGLKLTSQIGRMFKSCGIEAICPLDFTGETSNISATEAFRSANKITSLKFNGLDVLFTGDRIFSACSAIKQIEIEGKGAIRWGWQLLSSMSSLKTLPKMDASASSGNLNGCISAASALQDTFIDMTRATSAEIITMPGCPGIKGLTVSNEAPFSSNTSPQLSVANCGLDRAALVNLFKSMPYNVGYTVEGNPTIVDGVASDFTSSDYLSISLSFYPNTSDFEIGTEVKTGNLSSNQRIISDGNVASTSTRLIFSASNKNFAFAVYDRTNTQQYEVASSVTVSANSNYAIKAYRQGTTLAISVSADGTNWTTDTLDLPATASFSNIALQIGQARNFPFSGSINLNNTDINVNGIPWFRGTAAMTKTVSVVGCTGTADLTAADKAIAEDKGWSITLS